MCDTDLDLDLEFAADEEVAGQPAADTRYAGVAWGLAGADMEADIEKDVQATPSG